MKQACILIALIAGLGSSCTTDFEVNAPYKETMVVYGLLNTNDSIQYIRISKAFLGEGSALDMAQQPDSFNYGNILNVKLEKLNGGATIDQFALNLDTSVPKDTGVFASPYQEYYTTNHAINDDGSSYRLTVLNTVTGVVATSTTLIVRDITVLHPTGGTIDFVTNFPLTADFAPTENAVAYDLVIVFHYSDIDSSGGITQRSVNWDFSEVFKDLSSSGNVEFFINRHDFFMILGTKIPVIPGIIRRVDMLPPGILAVEFKYIACTEDLITYQQLLQPSGTFLQDPPLFTTMSNGLGIFTSRLTHSDFKNMSSNTKNAFDTSSYCRNLGFEF